VLESFNSGALQKLYTIKNGMAVHPSAGDNIPWLQVWLLTGFNRKHVLSNGKVASPKLVGEMISNITNKIKWARTLRNSESDNIKAYKFKPKSLMTTPCNRHVLLKSMLSVVTFATS